MKIAGLGYYLPEYIVTNEQLLKMIMDNSKKDQDTADIAGLEKKLTLNKAVSRHFRDSNESNLDMATKAVFNCLKKADVKVEDIDLIMNCSMARMYVEPPMSVMLQHKLKAYNANIEDITNACLGFLNAMEIAKLYIESGKYSNILLVSSETCSDWIPWDKFSTNKELTGFSALTIADAAVAMLLQPGGYDDNFKHFDFKTFGQYNDLCQIKIGKSDRDLKIEVKSKKLAMVAMEILSQFIPKFLHSVVNTLGNIDIWFFHQVTGDPTKFYGNLEEDLQKKSYLTFSKVGNTGSATIPLGMAIAEENNCLKRGDCVATIVGASGFSYGGTYFIY